MIYEQRDLFERIEDFKKDRQEKKEAKAAALQKTMEERNMTKAELRREWWINQLGSFFSVNKPYSPTPAKGVQGIQNYLAAHMPKKKTVPEEVDVAHDIATGESIAAEHVEPNYPSKMFSIVKDEDDIIPEPIKKPATKKAASKKPATSTAKKTTAAKKNK